MATPAAASRQAGSVPGLGAMPPKGTHDDLDAPLGPGSVDSELTESPVVLPGDPGCGEGVEPPVVLGRHQVQCAAVQPGHHERSPLAERGVDIGGHQAVGSAADGQPEPPFVLGLHGQHLADYLLGAGGPGPGQALGDEPPREDVRSPTTGHDGHRRIRVVGVPLGHRDDPVGGGARIARMVGHGPASKRSTLDPGKGDP